MTYMSYLKALTVISGRPHLPGGSTVLDLYWRPTAWRIHLALTLWKGQLPTR